MKQVHSCLSIAYAIVWYFKKKYILEWNAVYPCGQLMGRNTTTYQGKPTHINSVNVFIKFCVNIHIKLEILSRMSYLTFTFLEEPCVLMAFALVFLLLVQ